MTIAFNHRMGGSSGRRLNRLSSRLVAANHCGRRPAPTPTPIDFSLIHDVQRRATGANIHSIAQRLQIYVSAMECGAMARAQSAEAELRAFLVA